MSTNPWITSMGCFHSLIMNLAQHLALDEALLLHAEELGRESLRLWEWPAYAVVLGAGGKVADDVHEDACHADTIPLYRRASGGGTVLLGPGCLLFSVVLSFERDPALAHVVPSYRWIMQRLADALRPSVPAITLEGSSDLALNGLKVSGNSQQRKRRFLLHHGTLLYNFDLERIPRYLKMPGRQPDYRADRPHLDFVANLPLTREQLESRVKSAWDVELVTDIDATITLHADKLAREKYERRDWIYRR